MLRCVGEIVRLVRPAVSEDTVTALDILRAEALAKAGIVDETLIGLAYVAIYRGGKYVCDIAGDAKNRPAYTLGLVRLLDHKLAGMIAADDDGST